MGLNDACQCTAARADDITGQVEFCSKVIAQREADQSDIKRLKKTVHSLQDKTRICEHKVRDLASEVWRELEAEHQEQSQGLSEISARLHAKVSEFAHRISVQEDALSNVEKAISFLDIMGAYDDSSLSSFMATPNFGLSSFSDARSSIARQSFEGRPSKGSDFMSNSPLGHSQNTGSLSFDTPAPVRNTGTPACRMGELAWHDEGRDLDVCPEEESPLEHDRSLEVDAHYNSQVGLNSEDEEEDEDEDMTHSRLEKFITDISGKERRMLADLLNRSLPSGRRRSIINSANSEHRSSSKSLTSLPTNRSVDSHGRGWMELGGEFPKGPSSSSSCKRSHNSHVRFRGDNAASTKTVFFK